MDLFQIANVLNNNVEDFELKADMQKYFVSMYPEAEQLEGKEVKKYRGVERRITGDWFRC